MTDLKITPALLDELEALEQAATPGEWVAASLGSQWGIDAYDKNPPDYRYLCNVIKADLIAPNARLIAASRNALPALIQEVRRLWQALESGPGTGNKRPVIFCLYCGSHFDSVGAAAAHDAECDKHPAIKRAIKAERERDALAKGLAELHEINVMLVDGAPEGSHTAEYWIKWAEQQTKEEA